ncbi:hyccin-like isoform X2 [Tachypleus tridentatus]|uniref:hyccin-like isoform X2 n=1 Tax=Tachypleus tridentatus TaxID=6853 RepID=UPI003FD0E764
MRKTFYHCTTIIVAPVSLNKNEAKGMADTIVQEWLADYRDLSLAEVHSFASTIKQNSELIQAIFTVLEEKKYHVGLLESVCHQLFSFYRSDDTDLQMFTLQYLPVLLGIYLCAVARGERKNVWSIEVLLLGIYNLEAVNKDRQSLGHSFHLPCISKPSIYHEPISSSHSLLTEHALSKHEHKEPHFVTTGSFSEVEKINASNRLQIVTLLQKLYNHHISLMPRTSHFALCRMCSKLVRQGFVTRGLTHRSPFTPEGTPFCNHLPRPAPRVPVSSSFLMEMLYAIYFSMFNGVSSAGIQALEDIHSRASQELFFDVLLVSNAVKNSLKTNPSGQPSDGPMGLNVSLSQSFSSHSVTKTVVTNASFRTKKLPDDIPIQSPKEEGSSNGSQQLTAITEEQDDCEKGSAKGKDKSSSENGNASGTSKLPVLQLRKDKSKFKKEKDVANDANNDSKVKDQEVSLKSNLKNWTQGAGSSKEKSIARNGSEASLTSNNTDQFSISTLNAANAMNSSKADASVSVSLSEKKNHIDSIPEEGSFFMMDPTLANNKVLAASEVWDLECYGGDATKHDSGETKLLLLPASHKREIEANNGGNDMNYQTIV